MTQYVEKEEFDDLARKLESIASSASVTAQSVLAQIKILEGRIASSDPYAVATEIAEMKVTVSQSIQQMLAILKLLESDERFVGFTGIIAQIQADILALNNSFASLLTTVTNLQEQSEDFITVDTQFEFVDPVGNNSIREHFLLHPLSEVTFMDEFVDASGDVMTGQLIITDGGLDVTGLLDLRPDTDQAIVISGPSTQTIVQMIGDVTMLVNLANKGIYMDPSRDRVGIFDRDFVVVTEPMSSGVPVFTVDHNTGVATASGVVTHNLLVDQSADLGGLVVHNVATPLIGTDAANKNYVDSVVVGGGGGSGGAGTIRIKDTDAVPSGNVAEIIVPDGTLSIAGTIATLVLDNRYYTQAEIDASGFLTGVHNHNNLYYTKTEVDASGINDSARFYGAPWLDLTDAGETALHKHDNRYYTQTEIDTSGFLNQATADGFYLSLLGGSLFGSLDMMGNLLFGLSSPTGPTDAVPESYLVSYTNARYYTKTQIDASGINDSTRFYGAPWVDLTDNGETLLHHHDGRYYTQAEIDASGWTTSTGHNHNGLYYTKTQIDASGINDSTRFFGAPWVDLTDGGETLLHHHDGRYYTQSEIDASGWTTPGGHSHDNLYYTKTQIDASGINDSTKFYGAPWLDLTDGGETTAHIHDDRYYRQSEIDASGFLNYARASGIFVDASGDTMSGHLWINPAGYELVNPIAELIVGGVSSLLGGAEVYNTLTCYSLLSLQGASSSLIQANGPGGSFNVNAIDSVIQFIDINSAGLYIDRGIVVDHPNRVTIQGAPFGWLPLATVTGPALFQVYGSGDVIASGNIEASGVYTKNFTATANISMGSQRVKDVAMAVLGTDAVNLSQVASLVAGSITGIGVSEIDTAPSGTVTSILFPNTTVAINGTQATVNLDARYYTRAQSDASGINNSDNFYGPIWTDLTDSGETTRHIHDDSYYRQSEIDGSGFVTVTDGDTRYVNITGDTMSGPLQIQSTLGASGVTTQTDVHVDRILGNSTSALMGNPFPSGVFTRLNVPGTLEVTGLIDQRVTSAAGARFRNATGTAVLTVDSSIITNPTGRVVVGAPTSTPAYQMVIAEDLIVDPDATMQEVSFHQIGPTPSGQTPTAAADYFVVTRRKTSTGASRAGSFLLDYNRNQGGSTGQTNSAINAFVYHNGTTTLSKATTDGGIIGGRYQTLFTSTGGAVRTCGISASVNIISGSAAITDAIDYFAFGVDNTPTSACTITNAYDFYGAASSVTAPGVITNAYGMRLEKQTVGAATNWQIFNNDGNSFMGGKTYIGGTTAVAPSGYLHFAAGSATAGTAPIVMASGVLLTTTHNGAIEMGGLGPWLFYSDFQTPAIRRAFAHWNAAAMTWSATITLDTSKASTFTGTANADATINQTGIQLAGQTITFIITCDGSIRTTTFGTGFKSTGTLIGIANQTRTASFCSDGTFFWETSRTAAVA